MKRRHFLQLLLGGLWMWRLPRLQGSSRVEAFLSQMDVQQKAGQLCLFSLTGTNYSAAMRRLITDYHAGGMVLFGYNVNTPAQLTDLTNAMQRDALSTGLPIPLFVAADQEGGRVLRLRGEGFSPFPSPMALGAADDLTLTLRMGAAIAEEMQAYGLNLNLAPVLDVNTTPQNPVINIRSFGSDPARVAQQGEAFIKGLQSQGVIATGKHFPGHGSTIEDSHYALPVVTLDREAVLREMQPFVAGIEAQVGMMMTAHVVFSGLDNTPATFSAPILTDLLRGELGYEGVIVSDALTMGAVSAARDNPAYVLRDALLAGVDMLAYGALPGGTAPALDDQIRLVEMIVELVDGELVTESRLDESVRRVLTLKEQFGVLDWQPLEKTTAQINTKLLDEAAQKAVTLLSDENQLLPFASDAKIALLYPADYPWWGESLRGGLPNALELPYSLEPQAADIRRVVNRIGERLVLCLTADTFQHPQQVDLINALPLSKTIVVAGQSPYDLLKFPLVTTYLMTYGYTPQGFQALLDILTGKQLAQGKPPIRLV